MTDKLRLKLNYYIRTWYDPIDDDFGVICKLSWYKFYYDEINNTLRYMINNKTIDIKEGDIPEPPKVNRVSIEVPGFWSALNIDEFAYEHNKWMFEQRLLEKVQEQTLRHLQTEAWKNSLDIEFDIDWERIDPPKI